MPLTLSDRDLRRLQTAQQALLSPLEFASIPEWCTETLRRVERFFRADRSMFVLPLDGRMRIFSESLDPWVPAAFEEVVKEMGPGSVRFRSSSLDEGDRRRSSQGIEVYSNEQIDRLSGGRLFRSPFYHEILRPAGVVHGSALTTALPLGDARLAIAHSRAADDPFGEADGLKLLRLLLPAFKAGLHATNSLQARRVSLAATVDQLAEAVLVVDADGRELHRSLALRRLLEQEPKADLLLEMRSLANQLCRLRQPETKTARLHPAAVGLKRLRVSGHLYELRGGYLAPGAFGRGPAALVSAEHLTPELPSAEALRERHGLTAREAEVARLLALGLSNKQIAERLYLSPHTVRTHAQHVFQKLGIHSRNALALRLLEHARKPLRHGRVTPGLEGTGAR